jgi:hypothetical protein
VSVTMLEYVREVGYVTELVEHCFEVNDPTDVPYVTHGWSSFW